MYIFYNMCNTNFGRGNPTPATSTLYGLFTQSNWHRSFPLSTFRDRKATDRRYCVFAFVGLVPELQEPTFVDYSQSVEEVYRKTAIVLIEETGKLDEIMFAVPTEANNFDLPS